MPEPRVNAQQKAEVKQRAKECCEYCWSQEEYSPDTFSVEHIIPLVKGGSSEADNLANSCQGCNNHKFVSVEAIDPLTGEIASLYHPRRQRWSDHFAWNENYTVMVGLTPTGSVRTFACADWARSRAGGVGRVVGVVCSLLAQRHSLVIDILEGNLKVSR